jgi:hypothetical protein
MIKRFQLGLVALIVLALSVTGASPALAKDKGKNDDVKIQYNCKKSRVKPTHVELGCHHRHTSKTVLRRIKYRSKQYGNKNVRGRADISLPNITGNPQKVKVRFKRIHNCKHHKSYRRVTYKFRKAAPAGYNKRDTVKLGCH